MKKKQKTYPCTFPIYVKDGSVIRCWHCLNCKKFVKYLKKEIKNNKDSKEIQVDNIRYYFTTQTDLWSK